MGLPVPQSLQRAGNIINIGSGGNAIRYNGNAQANAQQRISPGQRQAADNKRAFALARSQVTGNTQVLTNMGPPPSGMTGLQYLMGGGPSNIGDYYNSQGSSQNQVQAQSQPQVQTQAAPQARSQPAQAQLRAATPRSSSGNSSGSGGGGGGSSGDGLHRNPRVRAFLDTIAFAEGADYNVMFGGGTFNDFSRHPDQVIRRNGYASSAAGRYQFLTNTWNETAQRLGLTDFSPESQDRAAVQLLRRRGALDDVINGNFDQAVFDSAPEWASLPTRRGRSYYGQPVRSLDRLRQVYQQNLQRYSGGA